MAGAAWAALAGGSVNGYVLALAKIKGALYVGGSFASAGGYIANNVAEWDGSRIHGGALSTPARTALCKRSFHGGWRDGKPHRALERLQMGIRRQWDHHGECCGCDRGAGHPAAGSLDVFIILSCRIRPWPWHVGSALPCSHL